MADDNVDDNVDDYNDYDDANNVAEQMAKVCKVYDSEDFFTIFVQLLLAFFALMSLWFKRQRETPRRKFRTWFLDCSKQGVGACYAHVLNMVRTNRIRLKSSSFFIPLLRQFSNRYRNQFSQLSIAFSDNSCDHRK